MPMYDHIHKTPGDAGSEEFDPYKVLHKAKDDGLKPQHDQSVKYGNEFKQACAPWDEASWKPGPVGQGGGNHPKGDGYNTKPVEAASPTGKYGKPGGSGAAMNNSNRESTDQSVNPQKQGQG
mgnify:CR=1 FL=1